MIGVTMFTDSHYELAQEAIRRFKKHTGLTVLAIHLNEKKSNSFLRKLWVCEYVANSAVFFDADLWFDKDFDFSQFENEESVFGVLDPGWNNPDCFVTKDCKDHGLNIWKYINTGLFVFNKRLHSHIFDLAKKLHQTRKVNDFGEQTYFNIALQETSSSVVLLGDALNFFIKKDPLLIQSTDSESAIGFHAAAFSFPDKLTQLRKHLNERL